MTRFWMVAFAPLMINPRCAPEFPLSSQSDCPSIVNAVVIWTRGAVKVILLENLIVSAAVAVPIAVLSDAVSVTKKSAAVRVPRQSVNSKSCFKSNLLLF